MLGAALLPFLLIFCHDKNIFLTVLFSALYSMIIRGVAAGKKKVVLIATGCHRGTSREELVNKFGEEIVARERIVVHDCDDIANMVLVDTLPSGGRLLANRIAAEADLLVSEGFIEPHFFAGFSGGRKSVLPGVCARETVMYNHNAGFIRDPLSRTGVLDGNPIHGDMLYAARKVGLAFIVNVVINAEKEAIFAVAGDADQAHRVGCDFLRKRCMVPAVPSDIVITTNGGYPLDQNIYQAVKGMTAAEATVKRDGVIIMLAKSADGHGGEGFYKTFRDEKDLTAMMQGFLATPPEKTKVDQWQSQIFARVLMHARVICPSSPPLSLPPPAVPRYPWWSTMTTASPSAAAWRTCSWATPA